jgi:glycerol-3-phosphate acyltransferase PlsX
VASSGRTTIAVDMLGGDSAPEAVVDAVGLLRGEAGLRLVLVGPADRLPGLLAGRGIDPEGLELLHAPVSVPMDGHPLDAVRRDAQRDEPELTVTAAARAVRDGRADAWVSVGHTGAAVAAAVLSAGRIPGIARPALAVVLPALKRPVVLLDAGASMEASSQVLAQFAVAGWCYARALGIDEPRVGLLSIGSEPGKGDDLRREAEQVLAEKLRAHRIEFAGPVEGDDVVAGLRAQVVVTDGFTGNVLLKGIEGAVAWAVERIARAYGDPDPARRVMREVATGEFAGGMLLGVNATTVVGHGAGSPAQIAACIRLAARAVQHGLIEQVRARFAVTGAST